MKVKIKQVVRFQKLKCFLKNNGLLNIMYELMF